MTNAVIQTIASISPVSAKGYKTGDLVVWDDPDNCCRWGRCAGTVMIGTEDYNEGQMVVFWYKSCTRHGPNKGTESDNIDRPHVKIAFAI